LVRRDPIPDFKKVPSGRKDPQNDPPFTPQSKQLWENLRALRLELAQEQNIPAFVIFHDSTLKEMVRSLPRTLQQMRQVSGIGQKKLELYGEQFLACILEHLEKEG
jgi:ATP-dependent DNA helicase RecQ